ncbi:hypothetical protein PR048_010607 [Dryococelus australis]|uniref:Uncharacterized protein n=1 Tax=Dryococelus australis TaxID=614101 RepID=A0ABQ9I3N1_9NEOP|nr:hypothetical protein PR048_010607 [Dryococelus australis]
MESSAGMKVRWKTGDPRENQPTSGIVRHEFHIRERPRRESNPVHAGAGRRGRSAMKGAVMAAWWGVLCSLLASAHVAAIGLEEGVQTTPKVGKGTGEDMLRDGIDVGPLLKDSSCSCSFKISVLRQHGVLP